MVNPMKISTGSHKVEVPIDWGACIQPYTPPKPCLGAMRTIWTGVQKQAKQLAGFLANESAN